MLTAQENMEYLASLETMQTRSQAVQKAWMEGYAKGYAEGKILYGIVRRMKGLGLPLETITAVTGLAMAQVADL